MAEITVQLELRAKWWMKGAVAAAALALHLGLIRDAASSEHWGGRITAEERVAKWLADFAFSVEAR